MPTNSQNDKIIPLYTAPMFGIPIFSDQYSILLKKLQNHLLSDQRSRLWWLTTPNAEQMVLAARSDSFRSYLMDSTLAIPDGASLVFSAWLLALRGGETKVITERISGVDLMIDLVAMAADQNKKVMLVGGKADVSEKAAAVFRSQYSHLHQGFGGQAVLGIEQDAGAQDIQHETKAEKDRVMGKIRKFRPDLVFVGYGAPAQEKWIADNRLELEKFGVKIVMGVGGAFEMIAGTLKRAPAWMREAGLEWLWRLGQEPWRWRRQTKLLNYWGMVLGKLFQIRSN